MSGKVPDKGNEQESGPSQPPHLTRFQERFFELSIDLLCQLGFDGHFKRLNPAWERTLGYTKVRDDANYWHTVESYLEKATSATLSHGICPDCMASEVEPLFGED